MRTENARADIIAVLVALSTYIPELDRYDGVTRRCQFCEGAQSILEAPSADSGHKPDCPVMKAHQVLSGMREVLPPITNYENYRGDQLALEKRTRVLELLLGWLAIILASAVAAYTYFVANGIPPDSVQRDLLGFSAVMLALALGVTLDGVFDLLLARVLLALATLIFGVVTYRLFSFGLFLWPSLILAVGTTLLAFLRPHGVS